MAGFRRGARWVHLAATGLFVLGIVAQFFLAGLGIFGGGVDLDPHETVGWVVHAVAALVLLTSLLAWLPWRDIVLSFVLAVLTQLQVMLPGTGSEWLQALHVLNALVLFVLAHVILRRDLSVLRRRALPAPPRDAPAAYGETAAGKPPAR